VVVRISSQGAQLEALRLQLAAMRGRTLRFMAESDVVLSWTVRGNV
jgi:hypothetical protein